MIDFKELLQDFTNSNFEEVIEKAGFCADFNAHFLKIKSYIALNRPKAALQYYEQNRKIIEDANLINSLKILIYLLCHNGYPIAITKKLLANYQDYPDQNYETYEFLQTLNDLIDEEYKQKLIDDRTNLDKEEELKEYLENQNIDALIDFMNSEDFNEDKFNYEHQIVDYLRKNNDLNFMYKFLACELIKHDSNEHLTYHFEDKYFSFVPSDYAESLFVQITLLSKIRDIIFEEEKDISILSTFSRILSKGHPIFFPKFIETDEDARIFAAASLALAYRLFDYESLESPFVKEAYANKKDKLTYFYNALYETLLKK